MSTIALATLILIGSFFIMLAIGIEIMYALGFSAFITCWFLGMPISSVFQTMIGKISNTSLMAIPFFMLMGEFMSLGGISNRLVELANALVGWMRGGLAMVNCVDSMFFGGISGSPVADCASLGPILIPMMEKQGYSKEFATGLTMSSSIVGMIIPPSHTMVIYAVTAGGVSIAGLYMGGIIAGVLLGVCLMVYSYIMAVKHNYPYGGKFSIKRIGKAMLDSIWGIIAMLIVVGGVFVGIMTATEAAAAAALYCVIIAFFVTKEAKIRHLPGIFKRTIKATATVLFLASTATAFSWIITYLRIPQAFASLLLGLTQSKFVLLLIINAILVVMGCFMNTSSIILIMVPILLPVVQKFGMSPIQFGIMVVMNLGIGLLTPPVGSVLFIGSSISGLSLEKVTKAVIPHLIAMLFALMIVTYVPAVTTFLPKLFHFI